MARQLTPETVPMAVQLAAASVLLKSTGTGVAPRPAVLWAVVRAYKVEDETGSITSEVTEMPSEGEPLLTGLQRAASAGFRITAANAPMRIAVCLPGGVVIAW